MSFLVAGAEEPIGITPSHLVSVGGYAKESQLVLLPFQERLGYRITQAYCAANNRLVVIMGRRLVIADRTTGRFVGSYHHAHPIVSSVASDTHVVSINSEEVAIHDIATGTHRIFPTTPAPTTSLIHMGYAIIGNADGTTPTNVNRLSSTHLNLILGGVTGWKLTETAPSFSVRTEPPRTKRTATVLDVEDIKASLIYKIFSHGPDLIIVKQKSSSAYLHR